MNRNPGNILSASRRTDIPAFYMDWFMDRLQNGMFEIRNPYSRISKTVAVSKEEFHTILFWSKNYGPFLESGAGKRIRDMGFNLYFNYTINSESLLLEPGLPPLSQRLEQLGQLADEFGPSNIAWRFDPICFFRTQDSAQEFNNLGDFARISEKAAEKGIRKCVTSFMDHYPKIQKRLVRLREKTGQTILFSDPPLEKKVDILERMERHLRNLNIKLKLCCEKAIFSLLEPGSGIFENACIDGGLLKQIFGGSPETRRDYGQRAARGCKCTKALDIGSYEHHPCFHNCLFCYAAPALDHLRKKIQ